MKTFKDGTEIPIRISILERVFQLKDYDDNYILCNLETAYRLVKEGDIESAKHNWSGKLTVIGKKNILLMGENAGFAHKKIEKMPETVKEWLETLPEPYRSQAIKNNNYSGNNRQVRALADAIDSAFDWDITDEGQDYWEEVYEKAGWGEFN